MSYEFSQDWFSMRADSWREHVVPRLPRPFRWLEIGSFEGRSACWMLDNVPGVQVTCVDPFFSPSDPEFAGYETRFDSNTRGRVEKIKSHSLGFLAKSVAERRTWHGCYIDGDHEAKSVLEDFVLAWHCVTVGGVIVFDDYLWQCPPHRAGELPPGPAIDSCLSIYASRVELLHKAWQVIVRKVRE